MIKLERFWTWLLFCFALVFLIALGANIITNQETLATYAKSEYASKQTARVPMQVRNMVNRAVAQCIYAENSKDAKIKEEFLDKCLTSLEAAMAQVFADKEVFKDNSLLYQKIKVMYDLAQNLKAKDLPVLIVEADQIDSMMGVSEVESWNAIGVRYADVLSTLDRRAKTSIWYLIGIIIIVLMIGTLIILKHQADMKIQQAQSEVERQRVQMIQSSKMSTLGEMASGVAHEINNPLTVIFSKSEKILNMASSNRLHPEAVVAEVEKIIFMTKRIVKIIKGLRSFARDGEKDPLEAYSVNTIIREVVSLIETKAKSHEIDLKVTEASPDVEIQCRSVQISQVLLNLIGNSLDSVESLPQKWVHVQFKVDGDFGVFQVIDSGNGISKEVQEKMFNPFFTTKEVGKGTGLGLSISTGIILDHNGKLMYDSNSKNTCFYFTIPLAKEKKQVA